MCLGPEASSTVASLAKRKRPAVFNRRPTMLPPSPLPSRCRFSAHKVEDDGPHVSFQEESQDQVHEIPTALSCLGGGEEQRHQLWYNKADIKEFRKEAQSLSKQLRNEPHDCCTTTTAAAEDDYTTRGLELRTSLQRQQRRQLIVKQILQAQEDDCEASELAQISKEHSIWSQKLALAQAHKDYYAVYHPNLTSVQLLPEMPSMLDCHRDLQRSHKRCSSSMMNSFEGRRVRCRMF